MYLDVLLYYDIDKDYASRPPTGGTDEVITEVPQFNSPVNVRGKLWKSVSLVLVLVLVTSSYYSHCYIIRLLLLSLLLDY